MKKILIAILISFALGVTMSSCGSQRQACPAYSQADTETEQVEFKQMQAEPM